MMLQIWQRVHQVPRPGYLCHSPSCSVTHYRSCRCAQPLCWYLRMQRRGGRVKRKERDRWGKGLLIYTLSRRRGASYGWSKPVPAGEWTERRTGAPGVFWPQLIWERVSHWMARRRGMMVGLAGGLERLLIRLFLLSMVGEACTVNLCWKSTWGERQTRVCVLEFSHNKIPRRYIYIYPTYVCVYTPEDIESDTRNKANMLQ